MADRVKLVVKTDGSGMAALYDGNGNVVDGVRRVEIEPLTPEAPYPKATIRVEADIDLVVEVTPQESSE